MLATTLAIRAKKEKGVSLRQSACGWVRNPPRAMECYSNIKIKKILSLAVKWSKLDDL